MFDGKRSKYAHSLAAASNDDDEQYTNNVNILRIRKTDSVSGIQNPSMYTLSRLVGSERKVGRVRLSHWLAECCNKGSKFRKGFLPSSTIIPVFTLLTSVSSPFSLSHSRLLFPKSFLFKTLNLCYSPPLLFSLSLGGYYRSYIFFENYKNQASLRLSFLFGNFVESSHLLPVAVVERKRQIGLAAQARPSAGGERMFASCQFALRYDSVSRGENVKCDIFFFAVLTKVRLNHLTCFCVTFSPALSCFDTQMLKEVHTKSFSKAASRTHKYWKILVCR